MRASAGGRRACAAWTRISRRRSHKLSLGWPPSRAITVHVLDHALRHNDSLVGLSQRADRLLHWNPGNNYR